MTQREKEMQDEISALRMINKNLIAQVEDLKSTLQQLSDKYITLTKQLEK